MHYLNGDLFLAATDLSNFLSCRHRTALDMEAAAGLRTRPYFDDLVLQLLFERGIDHERRHVESLREAGREVVDLTSIMDRDALVAATLTAMRNGTDVIVQGGLATQPWFGKPDLLQRVNRPSTFGDWSYEISDTKLALETRAGTVLQLGLYSEMLAGAQGVRPEYFHVVTPAPDQPVHSFRVDDYAAYFRLVRDQMAATVSRPPAEIAAEYYPEPVEHCQICPWSGPCDQKRRADDHLALVAGISRNQRRELEARGTATLSSLAGLPIPLEFSPKRGSADSYIRVREQARLQFQSRGLVVPLHELRDVVASEGLSRLPEPSAGDIFLDLEGDHMGVEGGREYLFGLVTLCADGSPEYQSWWALSEVDERTSFEAVMDLIKVQIAKHPEMHVYHYAPYEVSAFRRLMGRYATREEEFDGMLREGRFVDLYAVVRESIRAGIEGYSIKNLEPLYGFRRDVPLSDARRSLRALEYAFAAGLLCELPSEARPTVEGYNRDDCVSTLRLRDWLESVRESAIEAGAVIARLTLEGSAPNLKLGERLVRVEALRQKLLSGIQETPPEDSVERGRWLLAYLLDFHRREAKSEWARYFELLGTPEEDLLDVREALFDLEFRERVEVVLRKNSNKPTGSVVDRYAYPPQEMEIRRGDELKSRDGEKFGEVVGLDRDARTIDVKKGPSQAEHHANSVIKHKFVSTSGLEDAIMGVGEAVASAQACDGAYGIARSLLLRELPRLTDSTFKQHDGVDVSAYAVEIVNTLDHTVLAIQGPPGSGKTYTGARMIRALVAQGKRVGVTGPSHKAICNLLAEVVKAASGVDVRIGHKAGDDADDLPSGVSLVADGEAAARALIDGALNVVGGTAWLWSSAVLTGAVDVLFVDEAGQVPLANAIAISGAAKSLVLLGDPQQLDQPQKGSHPDGVDASVLQHVLGEHLTVPADRGIFLPITWRLSPTICEFTSEMFYESRLASKDVFAHQGLVGIDGLAGSRLWYIDVEHDGCTSSSDEEVEAVSQLVAKLTSPGSGWIKEAGSRRDVTLPDVLVVSPFNAQASRLIERLPSGARVGTVDKFQGQEAPVVIYSMATSRSEDAPRGMEFLYSPNRLNVATSRARCAVFVVANRRLFEPECRSPRQMTLANALCRYREMGEPA